MTASEEDVVDAISKITFDLYQKSDADTFLLSQNLQKNVVKRFVSWLVVLDKISANQDQFPQSLAHLYTEYILLRNQKLINFIDTPLATLKRKEAALITADILRSVTWFLRMAEDIGVDQFYLKNPKVHAHRILALLSLSRREFAYTQGFDRFVFVSFALGLKFASQCSLNEDFAEAMAFSLASALIPIVGVSSLLDDLEYSERHFRQVDSRTKKLAPQTAALLDQVGLGTFHFALRWELLLFADEHDALGLMLLWDQIIVRRKNHRQFMAAMCLAHIVQVPPGKSETMVETLQRYKNWDNLRLVNDSIEYFRLYKTPWNCRYIFFILIFIVLLIGLLVYRFWK